MRVEGGESMGRRREHGKKAREYEKGRGYEKVEVHEGRWEGEAYRVGTLIEVLSCGLSTKATESLEALAATLDVGRQGQEAFSGPHHGSGRETCVIVGRGIDGPIGRLERALAIMTLHSNARCIEGRGKAGCNSEDDRDLHD